MSRFLIIVISVYTLMHALVYFRMRCLLPAGRTWQGLFILLLAAMIFAPIVTRLLEKADHHTLARVFAYIAYPWMGFVLYAFLFSALLLAAAVLIKFANLFCSGCLPGPGRTAAWAVLVLAVCICVYGAFEAGSLRVERLAVGTRKLPEGVDRVRIAQISDVHLGLLVGAGKLSAVIDRIKAESPDILVSTGDLVDGDMDRTGELSEIFAGLRPQFGKFGVTGNHEVYVGLDASVGAERKFGFRLLRNETVVAGGAITIVGVDDPATGSAVDERALLKSAENGLFTLFLKHRPERPDPGILGLFDLQLSGHTHYGQLFPFRLVVALNYPLLNGPYFFEKGSVVYTSRGTATWGPPFRVLAPPEITIIDIVREG